MGEGTLFVLFEIGEAILLLFNIGAVTLFILLEMGRETLLIIFEIDEAILFILGELTLFELFNPGVEARDEDREDSEDSEGSEDCEELLLFDDKNRESLPAGIPVDVLVFPLNPV